MFTNIQSAKDFARHLKFALRNIDPSIKLHACQRITATMCLYNDWHHLEQVIPTKPHLPDHAIMIGRLQQELELIGLSRQAAVLFGEALFGHGDRVLDGEAVEVIVHPNGEFLLDECGDDGHSLTSSFLKSGLPQVVEYRRADRRWRFKIIPFNTHGPIIVTYHEDDYQALMRIKAPPEFIEAVRDYSSSWFDEKFLNFVRLAGLDISSIKPSYTDEAAASVLSEAYDKLRSEATHRSIGENFFAYAIAKCVVAALHSITDDRPLLKVYDLKHARKLARCFVEGVDYRHYDLVISSDKLTSALAMVGLTTHFEAAASILLSLDPEKVLVSDDHYMAPFHFLPSEHGIGCQPSLYGWPGSEKWKANYTLEGVALKPPHDPDDFAVILAQKHFEDCGVVFLDLPQAQAYLDRAAHKWSAGTKYWRLPNGLTAPKVSIPRKITAQFKDMLQNA